MNYSTSADSAASFVPAVPPEPDFTGVYFPARARVDLAALRANVATLGSVAPHSAVMAIVKADAYGHGLVACALAAQQGGAAWLGVAQVREALALRAAGITGPILAWLYGPHAPFDALLAASIDLSVSSPEALTHVVAAARRAGAPARIHIKVDTGLGRNGVSPLQFDELRTQVRNAVSEGAVQVIGIWSHLAFADQPGHPTIHAQCEVLDQSVRAFEEVGIEPQIRHIAASAATLTDPRTHYDLVRPGVALYGMTPVPLVASAEQWGLRPVMSLEADLVTVKPVLAGQGVSYNHHYVTESDTILGVVPLGYADGIPRHVSGQRAVAGAPVRISGANARTTSIAGRVCMDQFVLDLGPGATERPGDHVVLFGDPARGEPSAQQWAEAAGTINYEITTRLGVRVPREYWDGDDATPALRNDLQVNPEVGGSVR